jgi:hypothetical protein
MPRTDARQVQTIVKEVFSNRNAKRNTTNILLEIYAALLHRKWRVQMDMPGRVV